MSDDNDKKPPTKESSDSSNKLRTSKNVTVAFKLNGANYPLWARLMRVAIGSRGASSHITGRPAPPEPGSEEYDDWEETDLIVFSWIVDNIEPDIIADFAHHQTSKAIWESLATTFESSADPYLVYDLEEKANAIKQGEMDLEMYYRHLNWLWINVDRCQKQPVDCCDKGVGQFRQHTTTRRLFKFLAGLNECYDSIKRDVLKETPLPSVEAAYGWVKREAARRKIMPPSVPPTAATNLDSSSGGVGYGFGAKNIRPSNPSRGGPPARPTAAACGPESKIDRSKLWCSHCCGMQKHTRESCFQLVGYPDWWEKKQRGRGKPTNAGAEDKKGKFAAAVNEAPIGEASERRDGGGWSDSGERPEAMHVWTRRDDRGSAWNRREYDGTGGKGLGKLNPNPNYNAFLQLSPPKVMLSHKPPHSPHINSFSAPTPRNCTNNPQKYKNSQISPL